MFIHFDGRGCGCWDTHVAANAKKLGLKSIPVGHQQVVVQFDSWDQVPKIIEPQDYPPTMYRSIRIVADQDYKG